MVERRRTRYRLPWFCMAIWAVPILIYSAFTDTFLLAVAMVGVGTLWMNAAPSLELTPTDAVVRVFRARRIPWSAITEIRPMSLWHGGGTLLQTAWGENVRAPAPASWWGGPARPEQVAEITRWWVDHRGASWERPSGPRPWWPPPQTTRQ